MLARWCNSFQLFLHFWMHQAKLRNLISWWTNLWRVKWSRSCLVETDRISSKMMLPEDIDASCLSAGFILKIHFPLACSVLILPLLLSVFWVAWPKEGVEEREPWTHRSCKCIIFLYLNFFLVRSHMESKRRAYPALHCPRNKNNLEGIISKHIKCQITARHSLHSKTKREFL